MKWVCKEYPECLGLVYHPSITNVKFSEKNQHLFSQDKHAHGRVSVVSQEVRNVNLLKNFTYLPKWMIPNVIQFFFYLMNKKSGLTKITEIIVKLVNAYLIL